MQGSPSHHQHTPASASLGSKQAGSATHRPLETTLTSFLCLQGFVPSPVRRCWQRHRPQTVSQGRQEQPRDGQLQPGHCCCQVTENICPLSSRDLDKNITFLEPSHYTSTQAGSNVYFSTKCSHDNNIFIEERNGRRSWGPCQAWIKYHTSRGYRRVNSTGCQLEFKKTNTLTWQAHPPQNSQASRHNHSKPSQHYQRANLGRIPLLKKYLWHTWAPYTTP